MKATGLPVRIFADNKRGPLTEEGYVHWLEEELARARNRAREPEVRQGGGAAFGLPRPSTPRPPAPPAIPSRR